MIQGLNNNYSIKSSFSKTKDINNIDTKSDVSSSETY